ncbi:MAG: CGNR zinc finger domain-containing protein, partial [Actinomycetes bacterium]|nr:CGNR zinc finger domain-containing protein [Actinomycetes bacterium]
HLTHTTAFADVTSDVAAVVVPTVMELHARGWADRVRECAALDCWSLYVDLSNGGHQRHCSSACAARERTRRRRGRPRHATRGPGPALDSRGDG